MQHRNTRQGHYNNNNIIISNMHISHASIVYNNDGNIDCSLHIFNYIFS